MRIKKGYQPHKTDKPRPPKAGTTPSPKSDSWISVKDRLPKEGGEVLIYSTHCQTHGIYVASISIGISEAVREKMRKGELPDPPSWSWCRADGWTATPRSKVYKGCDEHGNNKVPYAWSHGPYNWNGQDVSHWMPLPKPPFIPEKKEEMPKCDAKALAEYDAQMKRFADIFTANFIDPVAKAFKETMTTLAMEGPNQFENVEYKPTCRYGCIDCVWDPAYIKATRPNWYEKLFGDKTPEEAAKSHESSCTQCKDGDRYDDEDK